MAAEVLVIWGEALYFSSLGVVLYAVAVTVGAHAAVRYVEEPELRKRFGASYEEYCRLVPRWLPRIRTRARPGGPRETRLPPGNRRPEREGTHNGQARDADPDRHLAPANEPPRSSGCGAAHPEPEEGEHEPIGTAQPHAATAARLPPPPPNPCGPGEEPTR